MGEMRKKQSAVSHDGHRQRMKERFIRGGLEQFSGHEVLELLLFYALPYRDTNDLGHRLENTFGSLANVLDADYADLLKVEGVTPHVATLLCLCGRLAHRYQKERHALGKQLYTTDLLAQFVIPYFIGKKEESVLLISLDNRRKLLNATRIFEGSVNSSQFNYRLAVQQALRDNATAVVLAHNHPNGFAIPSEADKQTTKAFSQVLELMDIRLIDHLIVADGDCLSMADSREMASLFQKASAPVLDAVAADTF